MNARVRAGFTLIEMMMVVAIIGILAGLVFSGVFGSFGTSREASVDALRLSILNGINTYRVDHERWPPKDGKLQKWEDSGIPSGKSVDYLTDSDYDAMMRVIVKDCVRKGSAAVMDPNPLIVATPKGADSQRSTSGQFFSEAVKKSKRHGATLKISDMTFGYAEPRTGLFCRFKVAYNAQTKSVTVERNTVREKELRGER